MASKIIIYSSTTCQPCRVLSLRLDRAGISHDVIKLDTDADALAALKARLGVDIVHTPTVEVDGQIVMQGLDGDAIRDLIEAHS
ncbi:NrdH-like glutaredoxin [Arthrobacter phage CallinAllBarbz]|uniref:NrdH-like glutaredoxin n=1 Tax=Arthrobacter phage CallinAllBarbz TaxID=3077790 RepID=A0AA96KAG2_9CAUD|nr:NrdH-like glutaredoxin [Arthrobacter phage CallinAllBarbz]